MTNHGIENAVQLQKGTINNLFFISSEKKTDKSTMTS